MSCGSDRVENSRVEPVEYRAPCSSFENGLNAIDILFLQLIYIVPRLIGRGRKTHELLLGIRAHALRNAFEIFRAVSAGSGKQRTTSEQLRSEILPAVYSRARLKHAIQPIAHATHRGHAAIKIRGKIAQHDFVELILARVWIKSARRPEMHMHVDKSGKDRLSGSLDNFRLYRFRIRPRSLVYFGNLSPANQHAPALNHLAVPDEDSRASNQIGIAAPELAVQNFGFNNARACVHLPCAQQQKRGEHPQQPQLCRSLDLLFFFPAEKFVSNKEPYGSCKQQCGRRLQVFPQTLI